MLVGLMCLKGFVKGNKMNYENLKENAMRLGSAFQKVNFLRDLKEDLIRLNQSYFPNIDLVKFDDDSKQKILKEIEEDFVTGFEGISKLLTDVKFGAYVAFVYYKKLLNKLKATPSLDIINTRIRVSNFHKVYSLIQSYFFYSLNFLKKV